MTSHMEAVLKALEALAAGQAKVRVSLPLLAQRSGLVIADAKEAALELERSGVLVIRRPLSGGWWYHLPQQGGEDE